MLQHLEEIPSQHFKEIMKSNWHMFDNEFLEIIKNDRRALDITSFEEAKSKMNGEIVQNTIPAHLEPKVKDDKDVPKEKLTTEQDIAYQQHLARYPDQDSVSYNKHFESGKYNCKNCDFFLFASEHKYASEADFATFHTAIGRIHEKLNEAECENCGAQLGTITKDDPPRSDGGKSYMINSASINFEPGFQIIN